MANPLIWVAMLLRRGIHLIPAQNSPKISLHGWNRLLIQVALSL